MYLKKVLLGFAMSLFSSPASHLQEWKCIHTLKHPHSVVMAKFCAQGKALTYARDNIISIWDLQTNRIIKSFTTKHNINPRTQIAVAPGGYKFAAVLEDNKVMVWNNYSNNLLSSLEGHSNKILSVAFSPDSYKVATASCDATVKIWNAYDGTCITTLNVCTLPHIATLAKFSPDNKKLVTASCDGKLQIWDTRSGQLLRVISTHQSEPSCTIEFSPDSNKIVTTTSLSAERCAKVGDLNIGQCIQTILKNTDTYDAIVCSNLAWIHLANFSPCGKLIFTVSENTVDVWDVHSGKHCYSLDLGTEKHWVSSLEFSPDGQNALVALGNGNAAICDVHSGNSLHFLTGHTQALWSAQYSEDGNTIITASCDGSVKIWGKAKPCDS